jgi:putative spermidine/putrescine transport system ATP-binding protein
VDALLGPARAGSGSGALSVAYLVMEDLRKRFGTTRAADGISIAMAKGETLALLGPSGSGKTTLLRLLAGFERPDAGRIVVAGENVTDVTPARRRFGMVFQHYALFPHLDVRDNIAFGLGQAGRGRPGDARVAEALARVDLVGFERRRVHELSGGQQQRVALARALAPEPRVLLLDEPLSNLDPTLRERTRRELRQLIARVGITTVFVTHEQEEAFDLGHRIAVLHEGRLEQVDIPDELYEHPRTLFVATFVGRANVLRERAALAFGGGPGSVTVIRPERLAFADGGVAGVVRERRYTGAAAFFTVEVEGGASVEVLAEPGAAAVGRRVHVHASQILSFPDLSAGAP